MYIVSDPKPFVKYYRIYFEFNFVHCSIVSLRHGYAAKWLYGYMVNNGTIEQSNNEPIIYLYLNFPCIFYILMLVYEY